MPRYDAYQVGYTYYCRTYCGCTYYARYDRYQLTTEGGAACTLQLQLLSSLAELRALVLPAAAAAAAAAAAVRAPAAVEAAEDSEPGQLTLTLTLTLTPTLTLTLAPTDTEAQLEQYEGGAREGQCPSAG